MSVRKLHPLVTYLLVAGLVLASTGMVAAKDPVPAPHGGLSTLGLSGWTVQSSALASQGGALISTPGFATGGWLKVKPDDAGAPGTEIGALLQNGACPDVFFSDNMRKCFGYTGTVGPVTVPAFAVPWWFRTDFQPDLRSGETATLILNGVIGQADVWVNGTQVADHGTVEGAFARYSFDITHLVRPGNNSLALLVYPNDPTSMYTLDDVDWNQIPPDNNTGFMFPIQLQVAPALGIGNVHVTEANAPDLSSSALTVKADLTNNTASAQTGTAMATIRPPAGGSPILLQRTVTVPAHSTQTVSFTPASYPQLKIQHPHLWWPYQMGDQPLYKLTAAVAQGGQRSESGPVTFAIRTITSTLTPGSNLAPQGARVFSINRVPFLFRGGGFAPDIFLHYSSADIANQIELIRGLGLNGIRTEGKEMPNDFYEQMDRAGIMIDAGFQCCDKWQPDPATTLTPRDLEIMRRSALTIGQRLRNHPSVINFSWSDNEPLPEQERVSLEAFAEADFQDPIIASAEYKSTARLGASGEKEGPYDWVPPTYWYDTTHESSSDPTLTNVGGSWAFDSETSAGHTVPTPDSIRRFLSPAEQDQLWKSPDHNQYHANYESAVPPCADGSGYCFGTLHSMDTALKNRYGQWSGFDQYVTLAQIQNYENTRSQFEAYIDHWTNRPTPATGVVYWQLNKGWPTLLWALYNNDYDQAGAYFGAKKANQHLHTIYTYDDGTVSVDNLGGSRQSDLTVESRVRDLSGRVLDEQVARGLALPGQGVANSVLKPKVPAATAPPAPAQTYFVELVLKQHGTVVDRNVYWRSTQADVVDWTKTVSNPQATMAQFGDLSALQSLPAGRATAKAVSRTSGNTVTTTINITNPAGGPAVAFFLRADVRRGNPGGTLQMGDNQILPITWSDNDLTLWPGQSQTVTATYRLSDLRDARPVVTVYGSNVAGFQIPA